MYESDPPPRSLEPPLPAPRVYPHAPLLVTWELTRACALRCRHCRAEAIPHRNPGELSISEVDQVLRELATLRPRPPTLIFTGGDPLERPDLLTILEHARDLGAPTAVAPSVTPRLTEEAIEDWVRAGVRTVSISLDGSTDERHDRFRGVPGTFAASLDAARSIVRHGLRLQINTSVCQETVADLGAVATLVTDLGAGSWELFFVVPTGRAGVLTPLSSSETEAALCWLADRAPTMGGRVTAVAAPQFRRIREARSPVGPSGGSPGIKEGRGFAFIDHLGNVTPSGYLPLAAGNVRNQPFERIYQEAPLFRALREPALLHGRCGRCAYRAVCGGSRARAYATSGDVLGDDPSCPFEPAAEAA